MKRRVVVAGMRRIGAKRDTHLDLGETVRRRSAWRRVVEGVGDMAELDVLDGNPRRGFVCDLGGACSPLKCAR